MRSRAARSGLMPEDDTARTWLSYFDRLTPDSALYRAQSELYVRSLARAAYFGAHQCVLDFGCGFGYVAAALAPLVAEIWFWDPSSSMRAIAEQNTAGHRNAQFCDVEKGLSDGTHGWMWNGPQFQLILVNSVVQYMDRDELQGWMMKWRSMMATNGRLILSDLIPSRHIGLFDAADLIRFTARSGFTLRAAADALGGLRAYRRISRDAPLLHVDREELVHDAAEHGLATQILPTNLTHFRHRWAAVVCRAEA